MIIYWSEKSVIGIYARDPPNIDENKILSIYSRLGFEGLEAINSWELSYGRSH